MTIRRLVIVRHAKAENFAKDFMADFSRRLTEDGYSDALKLAAKLHSAFPVIDAIVTSPAVRSVETAKIIANAYSFPISKVTSDERIYEGGPDRLLEVIGGFNNDFTNVIMLGHNPAIHNLLSSISPFMCDSFPAGAAAAISFDSDSWAQMPPPESINLDFYIAPK